MERKEMIEKLKNKLNISAEEAEEALEKSNWDILDAIIYLENKDKKEEKSTELITLSKENESDKKQKGDNIFRRFFKFLGKVLKKGNTNFFEIQKEGEKPIKISMTISVILLLFAFHIVAVLLVIGLLLGYKYSIVNSDINVSKVNDVLKKASESAQNIKNDFKEGYNNN